MDNETIGDNETEEPLDCGLCIKIEPEIQNWEKS